VGVVAAFGVEGVVLPVGAAVVDEHVAVLVYFGAGRPVPGGGPVLLAVEPPQEALVLEEAGGVEAHEQVPARDLRFVPVGADGGDVTDDALPALDGWLFALEGLLVVHA